MKDLTGILGAKGPSFTGIVRASGPNFTGIFGAKGLSFTGIFGAYLLALPWASFWLFPGLAVNPSNILTLQPA